MPIIGLNRIFDDRQAALESFGELGEREISRYDDGKQVLARYYDEDGNIASLIGIYHYKRTEGDVDYGNIEVKDYSLFDIEQYISIMVENIHEIENIIQQNTTNIELLTARLRICCAESPEDDTNYSVMPLTVEALTDGDFRFETYNGCTVKYRTTSNPVWETIGPGEDATISLLQGEKALFRGNNLGRGQVGQFRMDVDDAYHFEVYGNIMSLLYDWDFIGQTNLDSDEVFYYLFADCRGLISAENLILPATEVTAHGYDEMFGWCSNLLIAPQLPATAVSEYGYYEMFCDCDSLVNAPELPATELYGDYCYQEMFSDCANLVNGPSVLPATSIPEGAYSNMFSSCESLTGAPEIYATDLAPWCCESMFASCYSLVTAPSILPATELAEGCYSNMFDGCESLINAPELPATELAEYCYQSMFWGCSSLTILPDLPATQMAESCYTWMYERCESLLVVDEDYLPATELWDSCYRGMFSYCTSLRQAPVLRAEYLQDHCYDNMFQYCENLDRIVCYAMDVDCTAHTKSWLKNVAYPGTFRMPARSAAPWELDSEDGIPVNWRVEMFDYDRAYLTIRGLQGSDGTLSWNTETDCTLYYSMNTDYDTWEEFTDAIYIASGDIVRFKGDNYGSDMIDADYPGIGIFVESESPRYEVYGNIMSTLYDDNFIGQTDLGVDYVFTNLFASCDTGIISAKHLVLPSTQLTERCYGYMFENCTMLEFPPELPAKKLYNECYWCMFYGCESIQTAPNLPATILADNCYYGLFWGCRNLVFNIPELPVTNLEDACYMHMFTDCESLTTAPALPSTTLAAECYEAMFAGCINLLEAPELPATTVVDSCYRSMFEGCTSLTKMPNLPAFNTGIECYGQMFKNCTNLVEIMPLHATQISERCYREMFAGCTKLTEAPALPAVSLSVQCYRGMFSGCTSLVEAPELPALHIPHWAYAEMFKGCSSLSSIKCLATDISESACTREWVSGVSQTGTFVKDVNMNDWDLNNINGIPVGWTLDDVENYENMYFTAQVRADGVMTWEAGENTTMQYSTDDGATWTTVLSGTSANINLTSTDSVMFRNTSYGGGEVGHLSCNVDFDVYGNIMSLLQGDNFYGEFDISNNSSVFASLFENQTHLITAGKLVLPAIKLGGSCYMSMFNNCLNLVIGPKLPATILATYCYATMFGGTAITEMPKLPARVLEPWCYTHMFNGSRVGFDYDTRTNALPATTLANGCYSAMFQSCSSLELAPELPAKNLPPACYQNMFRNCTHLFEVICDAEHILTSTSTLNWLDNVESEGNFYRARYMVGNGWEIDSPNGIPLGWTAHNSLYENDILTFKIIEGGILRWDGNNCTIEYDLGSYHWSTLTSVNLSAGDIVYVKGNNYGCGDRIGRFVGDNGLVAEVYGNIMSLLYDGEFRGQTDLGSNYVFQNLFQGFHGLVSAKNLVLPAMHVTISAYEGMFADCHDLVEAPELPATTVEDYGYAQMFSYCGKLKHAPELPATDLGVYCYNQMFSECQNLVFGPTVLPSMYTANGCYEGMFYYCTSLLAAPDIKAVETSENCFTEMFYSCENLKVVQNELAPTAMSNSCCSSMFYECTSLMKAPQLPATELDDGCYDSMFAGCTNLRKVQETLPAMELSNWCYGYMFERCNNLEMPPVLPAMSLGEGCYQYMFGDCEYLERVTRLPATELKQGCYRSMFQYTKITNAPDLYAETLLQDCYGYMFNNCSRLKYIKCRAASNVSTSCLQNWVQGVASNGRFVRRSGTNIWPTGTSGIPNGWTVEQSWN